MRRRRRVPNWPFALAFMAVGLAPAWIGVSGVCEALSLQKHGVRAIGRIDRFDCPRRSTSCDVIVTFVAAGGKSRQITEGCASPSPDLVTGGRVEVLYLQRGQNEVVRLNRPVYLWGLPILLILVSAPFLCVGVYLTFMSWSKRR